MDAIGNGMWGLSPRRICVWGTYHLIMMASLPPFPRVGFADQEVGHLSANQHAFSTCTVIPPSDTRVLRPHHPLPTTHL